MLCLVSLSMCLKCSVVHLSYIIYVIKKTRFTFYLVYIHDIFHSWYQFVFNLYNTRLLALIGWFWFRSSKCFKGTKKRQENLIFFTDYLSHLLLLGYSEFCKQI